jgi:hypothetical protein
MIPLERRVQRHHVTARVSTLAALLVPLLALAQTAPPARPPAGNFSPGLTVQAWGFITALKVRNNVTSAVKVNNH